MEKLPGNISLSLLTTTLIARILFASESKYRTVSFQNDNNKTIRVAGKPISRDAYKINNEVKLSTTFVNGEASDVTLKNKTAQEEIFPVLQFMWCMKRRLNLNSKEKISVLIAGIDNVVLC